jgi:hypothetical protein
MNPSRSRRAPRRHRAAVTAATCDRIGLILLRRMSPEVALRDISLLRGSYVALGAKRTRTLADRAMPSRARVGTLESTIWESGLARMGVRYRLRRKPGYSRVVRSARTPEKYRAIRWSKDLPVHPRRAAEPLTKRDIARQLLIERALDESDQRVLRLMTKPLALPSTGEREINR